MRCKHEDGWLIETFEGQNLMIDAEEEVTVFCNHIGCHAKRKIKVMITELT